MSTDKPTMSVCGNKADYMNKLCDWQSKAIGELQAQSTRLQALADSYRVECDKLRADSELLGITAEIRKEHTEMLSEVVAYKTAVNDELFQLLDENVKLRADAERYRFLRDVDKFKNHRVIDFIHMYDSAQWDGLIDKYIADNKELGE